MPRTFYGRYVLCNESSDQATSFMCRMTVAYIEFVGVLLRVRRVLRSPQENAAVSTFGHMKTASQFKVVELKWCQQQTYLPTVRNDGAVFNMPVRHRRHIPAEQ